MAQPTPYDRSYSFTDFSADNPDEPLPGDQVDAELDALELTIDDIVRNLALLQRDDGSIGAAVVDLEALNSDVVALLAEVYAGALRGDWLTGTVYAERDIVKESDRTWLCMVAHTGGTFATDLAAGKWTPLTAAAGPTGPTGPTGPQGNAGAAGAQEIFTAIASQADAIAGTDNAKGSTSLRTAQAITGRLADAATALTGTSATQALSVAVGGGWMGRALTPGGRLSLTTALPVTTADVTAAAAIYYTPFEHNLCPFWNGTIWQVASFSELTLALNDPNHVSGSIYDIFLFSDSGTIRIGTGPAWSSDTARGTGAGTTELVRKDGRYVNTVALTAARNGAVTYAVAANAGLYLGSFRASGTATAEDSLAKRWLFNAYHRRARPMRVLEATDSWNYTTATVRQANGAVANQLDLLIGLSEDVVEAQIALRAKNATLNGTAHFGVGLDSVTAFTSGGLIANVVFGGDDQHFATAHWKGFPGIGRHYLAWLEYAAATGITTWYGDNGAPTLGQSGIHGTIIC